MRNPLRKRLLREITGELSKYLVILILLIATIGFVSGFLVADGSMLTAYNESFEKYNIEDGHFLTVTEMNRAQKKAVEALGITVYDQYYVEKQMENNTKLRIYADRKEVNTLCVMDGVMPSAGDEIALDRMYAENNDLKVGDTVSDGGITWKITALVALPDYSDTMFDSVKFGVAVVSDKGFERFDTNSLNYDYAWKYHEKPADEIQEKEMSENLLKGLADEVTLSEYLPLYQNQAIQFTGDDMGGDMAMIVVMLYMVIVILAFVFGITTLDTIEKEASVIGTLRASGYTRGELVRHYMLPPVLVTVIGAVIGNILGYTVFKDVCANMYYGSYSLPTYITVWSANAFWETTVVPMVIMLVVNYIILSRKLKMEPLRFLRHDLSRKQGKRSVRLNKHIPFFSRFRLRIVFQNVGNYILILIGILFANVLLMFGLMLPTVLSHYQDTIQDSMLSNYQYVLTMPTATVDEDRKLETMIALLAFQNAVDTENEDAEKFSAYTLDAQGKGSSIIDEIMFYGIEPDSRYVHLNLAADDVYVSKAYADKYNIKVGDTIQLKEHFEDKDYQFRVTGVYDYEGALCVFMTRDHLNDVFDLGDGMFGGYFSDTEITDIDSEYIGSVIDLESLTKVSRQLEKSMGSNMQMMYGFAILLFIVLIYLLSKVIIEKNAQSISMTKILGYSGGEISRLYIVSTSIVVVLCILISIPVEDKLMQVIWSTYVSKAMSGWLPYYLDPSVPIKMFVMGVLSYLVVAVLEMYKIKKVPMSMALKNVE